MITLESELQRKGSQPLLLSSKSGEPWLLYISNADGNECITAENIKTGETRKVSENGINSYDISAVSSDRFGIRVFWNQLENGVYQLYENGIDGTEPSKIKQSDYSVINIASAEDIHGNIHIVYQQSDSDGYYNIYIQSKKGSVWSEPELVSDIPGNNWCPAITACSDGKLAVAWDGYASGSYDIYLRFLNSKGSKSKIIRLTNDKKYNANVTLAPAPDGDVWVAWNKGTENWGKDNEVYRGTRILERGYLHTVRRIELKKVSASSVYPVFPPVQDFLDTQIPGPMYERPRLAVSKNGLLYLMFKFNEGDPKGGHRNEKRWQSMVTLFNGKKWSECTEMTEAYGLSSGMISVLPDLSVPVIAACGEGGVKRSKLELETKIYLYELGVSDEALDYQNPEVKDEIFALPYETEVLTRNSIEVSGSKFNVYFGDLHRHTELSFCRTSVDGSLEEAYRFSKDAAQMDFVMTADHDHQEQAPDMWQQTMKNADRFNVPGRYTAFYGYEWIGGQNNKRHRNIISAVPVPVPPFDYVEGHRDVRNLWATLERNKAITIPHHTACSMSLLWGKDPGEAQNEIYEPLVEIFQASRSSSEYPNCPTLCNAFYRSGEPEKFSVEGGFVSDALRMGYRLGFIASSDHMSAHRSYACIYATENTREALIEAMIARRTYAATDRIICEFSINDAVMGQELKYDSKENLKVYMRFVGTGKIREITLLRDSTPAYTWSPKGREAEIFTEIPASEAKGHYYYARMIQEDSNLAWASPIWIF